MIKPLRKKHLQIWILLAIVLPVGIAVAWFSIPKKATQELLQQPTSKTLSAKIISADTIKPK
jgi:hypothetical protein